MIHEYDVPQDVMTLDYENKSVISIANNLVQHIKMKHIDIRHHFIRDLVNYKIISLKHVSTKNQFSDIYTIALDTAQFEKLRATLGVYFPEF